MSNTKLHDEGRQVRIDGFDFSNWSHLPPLGSGAPQPAAVPRQDRHMCVGFLERVAAAVLLAILAPLMSVVALALKVSAPRAPVLYRQTRVGCERRRREPDGLPPGGVERRSHDAAGQLFEICKFRTMVPDAEKLSGPVWAVDGDPRITTLGRFMRYTRLDELPQLFNVVAGEMRLVGPRPERPHFVTELTGSVPDYLRRLRAYPGITGLAQVERHYDASLDDVRTKVKYDNYYVDKRTWIMDLKILLKTIDVVLRGRGAR